MPQWIREGYVDYVGKGTVFSYGEARQAFLANAPEMNFHRSGLSWRFNLIVAYLLDHQHWTVDRLLQGPGPLRSRWNPRSGLKNSPQAPHLFASLLAQRLDDGRHYLDVDYLLLR